MSKKISVEIGSVGLKTQPEMERELTEHFSKHGVKKELLDAFLEAMRRKHEIENKPTMKPFEKVDGRQSTAATLGYTTNILVYCTFGLLFVISFLIYVIKCPGPASRRREPRAIPPPRLVVGEITDLSETELQLSHSNPPPLSYRAQEYHINSNPFFNENIRNFDWPSPIIPHYGFPEVPHIRNITPDDAIPRSPLEDQGEIFFPTAPRRASSNFQTIRDPLTIIDTSRRNEISRTPTPTADAPPSYNELDVEEELELPPPSYYEVASGLI